MTVNSYPSMFQEDLYYFTEPVVVILKRTWDAYSPNEQNLLRKILTSVKVDINAVRILAGPSVEWSAVAASGPSRVLIFGADTKEDLASYEAVAAHGFTVIRADDLGELNEEKKKILWNGLRQMFGV
ncbi:MAG TPA: hypothetical protein VF490_07890 [Chryseosolibacter sp.]